MVIKSAQAHRFATILMQRTGPALHNRVLARRGPREAVRVLQADGLPREPPRLDPLALLQAAPRQRTSKSRPRPNRRPRKSPRAKPRAAGLSSACRTLTSLAARSRPTTVSRRSSAHRAETKLTDTNVADPCGLIAKYRFSGNCVWGANASRRLQVDEGGE